MRGLHIRYGIGVFFVIGIVAVASGQTTMQNPVGEFAEYLLDSGPLDNPGVEAVILFEDTVFIEGASWIRLYFTNTTLGVNVDSGASSYIRITSALDGEVQELVAPDLAMWDDTSAYFNGDTLTVELIAAPGTVGNRVAVAYLAAEWPVEGGSAGQCGVCDPDDRVPSSEDWACRTLPTGCSATVWSEDSCLVTAGHCSDGGGDQVAQFRVPPSNGNCSLNHPSIADQFPVTGRMFANGGIGNDWSVLTTGTNNVGQRPFDRYRELKRIAQSPARRNDTGTINGYGTDTQCTRNQIQQTHSGPITAVLSDHYRYRIDMTFGNSGSSILVDDEIVGINTHCQNTQCPDNFGTRVDKASFANARDQLCRTVRRTEIPFFDDFPEINISQDLWGDWEGAGISNRHEGEAPSEPFVLNLDGTAQGGDSISSSLMDTTGTGGLLLRYYYQRTGGGGSPEAGEDLIAEFLDAGEDWVEVDRQLGDGPDMETFELVSVVLPDEAMHDDFRLRFRTLSNASDDDWYIDDVEVAENTDRQPPDPDPMSFSSPPAPLSTTEMTMTAAEASDDEGSVEYEFDYDEGGGGGGHDSGPQGSRTYEDGGMTANFPQTYRVRALDLAGNATEYSDWVTASTMIETPTNRPLLAPSNNSMTIITTTSFSWLTFDQSGVFFDSTTSGGDTGINEWIQEAGDTAINLDPDKLYTFRLKARNRDAVETAWSPEASAATHANVPNPPALSGAGCDAMLVSIDGNGNPAITTYAIQCTDTDPFDGNWESMYVGADGQPTGAAVYRTAGEWGSMRAEGLAAETSYSFAATARNQDGVETDQGDSASRMTTACGDCVRDPAWQCDGDVDGDAQVNPVDSGLVQAAFGSGDEQDLCNYDIDCDGQINPVDSGIVQSLFGTCDPPRDVCP